MLQIFFGGEPNQPGIRILISRDEDIEWEITNLRTLRIFLDPPLVDDNVTLFLFFLFMLFLLLIVLLFFFLSKAKAPRWNFFMRVQCNLFHCSAWKNFIVEPWKYFVYTTKISKKTLHATCNKIDPDLFYCKLHAIFSLLTMTPSLSRQMLRHFYRSFSVKPIKIV